MRIFVDTSALYALLDEDDPHHAEAAASLPTLRDIADLVTHNYIHLESELLVRRRLGMVAAATLVDRLLPTMRTVWVDELTHGAAVEAWRAGGGRVSLVDHVSFIVMRTQEIDRAFAYDADFERHGFQRPDPAQDRGPRRVSERSVPYAVGPAGESELVSVAEVAARAGRSTNTIQSWRRRHPDFPAPVAQLATGPVWTWPPVAQWIATRPRSRRSVPLFESGISDLAMRADDYLEGFGER
jgi:predicted nucleic acid-binding protein